MSPVKASLPNADTIHRTVLPNGITVLVYENFAAQSVVVYGMLRTGSVLEPAAQNGLAALTASALSRGTTSRDFNTIAAAQEDIGADVNISSGTFRTTLYSKSLAEDLGTMLELIADLLQNPTFPEVQVERLRGEILTGLKMREQDTRYRAARAFNEALYPETHPLHYSVRGSLTTVPTISVADMREFHARTYGPDGAVIVVSGAVHASEAMDAIAQHLGSWTNPRQPDIPNGFDVPLPASTLRSTVSLAGKTQADLVLGTVGPSRFANDYLAASLANSVLGQFGMMGRIGGSVRETLGLAYYAYSQMEGGMAGGPWMVAAGVNPANLDLAIDRSVHELRRLVTEPVTERELSDVQSYTVGRLPLQLETNEGLASAIVNMEIYRLGLNHLQEFGDKIRGLTADDLLAAAQRYLHPDRLVIGIAGPPAN